MKSPAMARLLGPLFRHRMPVSQGIRDWTCVSCGRHVDPRQLADADQSCWYFDAICPECHAKFLPLMPKVDCE